MQAMLWCGMVIAIYMRSKNEIKIPIEHSSAVVSIQIDEMRVAIANNG